MSPFGWMLRWRWTLAWCLYIVYLHETIRVFEAVR